MRSPNAPVPPQTTAVPGYEILGELGRGGMGVVYKARQQALGRTVALKTILTGAHAGLEQRVRFRGEAEAAARLQHPNIVQVYEFGEQDQCLWFSLEFVQGRTLDQALAGAPMAPPQAAVLMEQLARAVSYAHQRGIIHRDLKPANILLAQDGTPKITDFGLAKRLGQESGHSHTGDVMGTPSYMAPEQAAGKIREIGPATDVYALGAILYEMLTGVRPFECPTAWDTITLVLSAEPERPSHRNPRLPRDLETICLKCLRKEPVKRYASAEAPARLWNAASGTQIGQTMHHRRRVVRVAFSPDGRRVATASADQTAHLWDAATGEPVLETPLQHAGPVRDVSFGPGGRMVLTASDDNTARLWDAQTRQPLRPPLRHSGSVGRACFSPDGTRVVTASEDNTGRVWDTRTGEPLTPALQHHGWGRITDAAFSPTGDRVVTASASRTARVWELRTEHWPVDDLDRLAQLLGGSRIGTDAGRRVPLEAPALRRLWDELRARHPDQFGPSRERH